MSHIQVALQVAIKTKDYRESQLTIIQLITEGKYDEAQVYLDKLKLAKTEAYWRIDGNDNQ